MITWIWIEGEKALDEFCMRRFKHTPRWMETIGTLTNAKVRMIYKHRDDLGKYVDMYLLYMDAPHDNCKNIAGSGQLSEIQRMSYEEIKADTTAILRR